MSLLINRLVKDHEHLLRLLDCLDHEVSGYKDESEHTPRLWLILDALDYLHNYPDSFHHPLESRLLSRLRPRLTDASQRAVMAEVEAEHKEIRQFTTSLIERFSALSMDQVIPVNQLLADYQKYVELQRAHIKKENRVLIPAMKAILTEEDFKQVNEALKVTPDPLFGSHTWESYENLYQFVVGVPVEQVASEVH
ncbi:MULTISPECIES: hemerythrin domain-containing protein [unclassified Endozoicomonas]|uniref:hemerythrin domain-containing protein n=1 Tax=unclassified Endozoicomonas TaxID=2644528 RepID=UPI002148D64F|nr:MULTISPECIES: hemerythrin domain-containing protein [unclassified Endozoicomonas]